jgi:ABC-2 type transport system ATP-binding protein
MPVIDVNELHKSYGNVQALWNVSFQIAEGEIVGLLGPNGAGKTTIIKILTGYLQQDQGTVLVDGIDVLSQPQEAQAVLGYLPENAPLYPELNVQNYLVMMSELRQIPRDEQLEHISEAIYAVGLQDHLTRPIGQLSKGYRQRLGLAQAILHRPRLLILDEPTVGLDPTQIIEIRRLIKRLAQHSTILFSTHILPEVEALCDRVIILMNGQTRADARLADLAVSSDVILVLDQKMDGIRQDLYQLEDVQDVEIFTNSDGFPSYRVQGVQPANLSSQIFQLASSHGWPVRELKIDTRTLESVFNELALQAIPAQAEAEGGV